MSKVTKSDGADEPFKLWPVQPAAKPQTFLQRLSTSVNYCISHRIQTCHIPPDLQLSQETYFLHQEIVNMQRRLKTSIIKDYEVQKGKILVERKRVIDKSS
jgi:hypothetical protein